MFCIAHFIPPCLLCMTFFGLLKLPTPGLNPVELNGVNLVDGA